MLLLGNDRTRGMRPGRCINVICGIRFGHRQVAATDLPWSSSVDPRNASGQAAAPLLRFTVVVRHAAHATQLTRQQRSTAELPLQPEWPFTWPHTWRGMPGDH